MTKLCRYLAVLLLTACAFACGTERWPVKVLRDPGAAQINFTPVASTVHELTEMKAPEGLRTMSPTVRLPEEKRVMTVDALLIGFKREADGDYHLVLADPVDRKKTMIAEIPSTECAPAKYSARFTAAGKVIEGIAHATPAFKKLPKPVTVKVTGVMFFDFIHGQTGVAPNGAELHPVLAISR